MKYGITLLDLLTIYCYRYEVRLLTNYEDTKIKLLFNNECEEEDLRNYLEKYGEYRVLYSYATTDENKRSLLRIYIRK